MVEAAADDNLLVIAIVYASEGNMFDKKFDLLKCPRVRGSRGEAVVNREDRHLRGKLFKKKKTV